MEMISWKHFILYKISFNMFSDILKTVLLHHFGLHFQINFNLYLKIYLKRIQKTKKTDTLNS